MFTKTQGGTELYYKAEGVLKGTQGKDHRKKNHNEKKGGVLKNTAFKAEKKMESDLGAAPPLQIIWKKKKNYRPKQQIDGEKKKKRL